MGGWGRSESEGVKKAPADAGVKEVKDVKEAKPPTKKDAEEIGKDEAKVDSSVKADEAPAKKTKEVKKVETSLKKADTKEATRETTVKADKEATKEPTAKKADAPAKADASPIKMAEVREATAKKSEVREA